MKYLSNWFVSLFKFIYLTICFIALVIVIRGVCNNPKTFSGTYLETCEQDVVCQYEVLGTNRSLALIQVTKFNNIDNKQFASYKASFSLKDFQTKVEKYAVKIK